MPKPVPAAGPPPRSFTIIATQIKPPTWPAEKWAAALEGYLAACESKGRQIVGPHQRRYLQEHPSDHSAKHRPISDAWLPGFPEDVKPEERVRAEYAHLVLCDIKSVRECLRRKEAIPAAFLALSIGFAMTRIDGAHAMATAEKYLAVEGKRRKGLIHNDCVWSLEDKENALAHFDGLVASGCPVMDGMEKTFEAHGVPVATLRKWRAERKNTIARD